MIRFAGIEAAPGDVVLLRGPNGSGKTSLLRALAGLEAPVDVGPVEPDLRGTPAAALPGLVALSPQSPRDALAGLTVEGEMRMRGRSAPDDIIHLAGRDVATLSSGEARRVALALAASEAPLLLLDEPAEGLDAEGRARVRDLVRQAKGVVVAADHAGLLDDLATRVLDLAPVLPTEDAPWPAPPEGPLLVQAEGFALRPGFHALTGPNGSGKTTLLRRLVGLVPGARLALPDPRGTFTRASVAEELRAARGVEALVPDALLPRHPLTLSGGEAQRVSLARTLGRDAKVYLLDEPEAHLDAQGRAAMLALAGRRVAEGACVLAATHDERLLKRAESVRRLEGA